MISVASIDTNLRSALIILIFLGFKFVLTKNEHCVTSYFQNIQLIMLDILVFCFLIKIIESQIEENSNIEITFKVTQFFELKCFYFKF